VRRGPLPLANGVPASTARSQWRRRSLACRRSARSISATRRSTSDSSRRCARGSASRFRNRGARALQRPVRSPQIKVDTAGRRRRSHRSRSDRTGGWSLVGQTLFSWAEGNGPVRARLARRAGHECPHAAPQRRAVELAPDEVGKAFGKLFGKWRSVNAAASAGH